ncbi:hypothetical protein Tco_0559051 [Tanacetum coccineum]
MAAEVPQTLEYRGGQLNVVHMLEVKIFTNWKKRSMCHIVGIESQLLNGTHMLLDSWSKETEGQWTDVSLDDSEMVEVKVLMALADDENAVVGKESARNGA